MGEIEEETKTPAGRALRGVQITVVAGEGIEPPSLGMSTWRIAAARSCVENPRNYFWVRLDDPSLKLEEG